MRSKTASIFGFTSKKGDQLNKVPDLTVQFKDGKVLNIEFTSGRQSLQDQTAKAKGTAEATTKATGRAAEGKAEGLAQGAAGREASILDNAFNGVER
jgi:hypothetical protein